MKPYLIQSAKFRNANKQGIDGIVSFNYMGSAEFEFGALGRSLKRIRENSLEYNITQIHLNRKHLAFYCHNRNLKEMQDVLENLALGLFSLKEYCSFKDLISYSGKDCKDNFWWDIENDWMVWEFDSEFNTKFANRLKL